MVELGAVNISANIGWLGLEVSGLQVRYRTSTVEVCCADMAYPSKCGILMEEGLLGFGAVEKRRHECRRGKQECLRHGMEAILI